MNQKRREELIVQLSELVGELGWNIIVPMSPQDQELKGLVIGTNEFLDQILYRFTLSGDEIIIKTEKEMDDTIKSIPAKKEDDTGGTNDGGPTFH